MPNVNVQVQTTGGGIDKVTINPERLRIPNGPSTVAITWKASGPTTFLPGNDAFCWISAPTAPTVTRVDDNTLQSASFVNNGAGVVWRYLIGVEENGVKIQVDPE